MSIVSSYGIEEIKLNYHESLLLEKQGEDGYSWVEVTYKIGEEQILIGSYSTYDYGMSRGWMKYNDDTIAIAKEYIPSYCIDGIQVEVLFDRKNRLFIEGSKEDLLEYYNQQFGNKNKKKKLVFKRNY